MQTVLITGGNGFVGHATLLKALLTGRLLVRTVVRRQAAIDDILKSPSAAAFHATSALTFAIVPDLTQPDALIEHAKDCSAIIHVAHPIGSSPGDPAPFTVGSTTAVLRAAEATASVKRVVWTSSVWGHVTYERIFAEHPDNVKIASGRAGDVPVLDGDSTIPVPNPVSVDAPSIQRYNYAKALGVQMLHDYSKSHPSSRFGIVILIPAWVLGPSELSRTRKEVFNFTNSNSLFLFLYDRFTIAPGLGLPLEQNVPMLAVTVHIEDVAAAHINALQVDLKGQGLRGFLLCSDGESGPVFDEAVQVVQENFPDEYKKMNPKAHHATIKMKQDSSAAEKELLHRPFMPYRAMVLDTIGWYRHLPE